MYSSRPRTSTFSTTERNLSVVGLASETGAFAKLALHDLECVDPGVQLPGVNQAPQDVVVEVAETPGRCPVDALVGH